MVVGEMNVLRLDPSAQGSISWPIVLFERDFYPIVFRSYEELCGSALAREMPDEIEAGFDAKLHRLRAVASESDRWTLIHEERDEAGFIDAARHALTSFYTEGRFRRRRASPIQEGAILQMSAEDLSQLFARRFQFLADG